MKKNLYALADTVFEAQGLVYALLTAQLALLLEYYILVFSPNMHLALVSIHVTLPITVLLYLKRQELEDGFVGTIEKQANKRTNRDLTEFREDE